MSTEAKELIRSLLQKNSRKRPTAEQALDHAYFQAHADTDDETSDSSDEEIEFLDNDTTPGIKSSNGQRPAPVISQDSSQELTESDLMNMTGGNDGDDLDDEDGDDDMIDNFAHKSPVMAGSRMARGAASTDKSTRPRRHTDGEAMGNSSRRGAGRRSPPQPISNDGG